MRLKVGDRVEVMSRDETPLSWRVAEILCCYGHSYCVQYVSYPGRCSQQSIETVSSSCLRPCPPMVPMNYNAGDIVEVFHEYAWRIAFVLNTFRGKRTSSRKQYLVRLIGFSTELFIDESSIRMRQTWFDNEWVLPTRKAVGGNNMISRSSASNCYEKMERNSMLHKKNIQDAVNFEFAASLKRMSPYCESVVGAQNGKALKFRAIEKGASMHRVVAATPFVFKVVDAEADLKQNFGEKNIFGAFKHMMDTAIESKTVGSLKVRNSELYGSTNDACSVGSCSVSDQSSRSSSIPHKPYEWDTDVETTYSDAESCNVLDSGMQDCCVPREEEAIDIHKLEVNAYRRTLEALYASGPLSWDQEELLTNLRLMLHISNDEHMMELKYLLKTVKYV